MTDKAVRPRPFMVVMWSPDLRRYVDTGARADTFPEAEGKACAMHQLVHAENPGVREFRYSAMSMKQWADR